MKIVVTGGSGRVGKYVVEELREAKHEVTVFDPFPPPDSAGVRWLKGDLQDLGQVISGFAGVDAIVHLAAYPIPYREIPDHVLFTNNTVATYNVHEAAFRLGISKVVQMSSGAIVGWAYATKNFGPEYLPVDENHPLSPQDPYGLAKLCGEEIARSFTLKCGMDTLALRPAWVLFPEMAEFLKRQGGRKPSKFDVFTYIDPRDLATATKKAVELRGVGHEAFYIVADDSTVNEPLCDLLPRLISGLGDKAKSLTDHRPGITNEKAKRVLQWQPRYSWRSPA